ncbi:hypothetical protein B0H67DRAFT_547667 [Lasiosphaeris hirsuta]|uniref:Uncharacterized protein n=1 Tax=Lasiosphaeris hirsuta TaxID=260670 RepID=A0AA40E8Z1_9PEZI|nr:hypothetical protein B0H67DRAFT_547667 [Lasiosphaeris hirsuta]
MAPGSSKEMPVATSPYGVLKSPVVESHLALFSFCPPMSPPNSPLTNPPTARRNKCNAKNPRPLHRGERNAAREMRCATQQQPLARCTASNLSLSDSELRRTATAKPTMYDAICDGLEWDTPPDVESRWAREHDIAAIASVCRRHLGIRPGAPDADCAVYFHTAA